MEAKISWVEGKTFVGQVESGHAIVLGAASDGHPKPGPSPMELLLIGTGGGIVMILLAVGWI